MKHIINLLILLASTTVSATPINCTGEFEYGRFSLSGNILRGHTLDLQFYEEPASMSVKDLFLDDESLVITGDGSHHDIPLEFELELDRKNPQHGSVYVNLGDKFEFVSDIHCAVTMANKSIDFTIEATPAFPIQLPIPLPEQPYSHY